MYAGETVAAVVPADNEAEFVGEVIETHPEYVDRAYVVDDASTDDTWSVIQRYGSRGADEPQPVPATDGGVDIDARLQPIRHEENRGVGGAIETGYERALADDVDVTVVVSGDGQMEPDVVEADRRSTRSVEVRVAPVPSIPGHSADTKPTSIGARSPLDPASAVARRSVPTGFTARA